VLLLGQFFVFNLFVAILLRHFEADSVEKQKKEDEEEVRKATGKQEV